MNPDIDRISLDERISNLEQMQSNNGGNIPSIDFDQFPDNCSRLLPNGYVFKFSIDNLGRLDSSMDGVGVKICLFSPRVVGFLFQHIFILARVAVTKVVNFAAVQNVVWESLIPDGEIALSKENMAPPPSANMFGYFVPFTFGSTIFANLFTNANGSALGQFAKGFSFNPYNGVVSILPAYQIQATTLYPSIGFTRYLVKRMTNTLSSMELFRPQIMKNIGGMQNTVATLSSLTPEFKSFFPTSWSV